ncbi:MAG TPA: hypothetical protein VFV51_17830 [Vicinamibacterales bacterium]|nr:hypothetical protein [Vicinamibacterales bacterium]
MVFMKEDEGRPLPALLLLFSMFAFAFVFHAVTSQPPTVPALFNTQIAALAAPVAVTAPVVAPAAPISARVVSGALPRDFGEAAFGIAGEPVALAVPSTLAASSSSPAGEPSRELVGSTFSRDGGFAALAAPVEPVGPAAVPVERGAVTRGFTTTGSVFRAAFKRAF